MAGMFFLMFAYNTYLQMRNLSDRNAKRPNLLLLVFSIILFMLITCVSCCFSGGTAFKAIFSCLRDPSDGPSKFVGYTRP